MDLTPEEREIGRDNYYSAVTAYDSVHRRDFLKQSILGGAGVAAGIGGMYFGYQRPANPVRVGIIGTGDEGNVLIGAINPDYVQVVSICDIRPSSLHRAFHGDWSSPNAIKVRPGLQTVYGWESEEEARRHVNVVSDYQEMLDDDRIEGVIIALPLHLHAKVAIEAMRAGKHVLVEKLMAHNVAQCKLMGRVSQELQRFLAIGHQRHYSILYDNAVNMIRWGLLGEVHHIRAQWHRNNLPGSDSWAPPIPGGMPIAGTNKTLDPIRRDIERFENQLKTAAPNQVELLTKRLAQWKKWDLDQTVDAEKYGYITDKQIRGDGRVRSALEELVRWRVWDRTGAGLMAELGSHQLDAASIFISALSKQVGHHVRPLSVTALGGRHLFPPDRDAADHVYCMFEFPGPGYDYTFPVGYFDKVNQYPAKGVPAYDPVAHPEKKIVVSYSSINGNGFGGYGEVVMGTKATLMLEKEQNVMLYPNSGSQVSVGVKGTASSAALDTSASGDPAPAKAAESASGPVSRGYREEIEHWAWCISTGDWTNQPRCNAEVGLADAVLALTAKLAIGQSQFPGRGGYIQFNPDWFDLNHDAVPEVEIGGQTQATISDQRLSLKQ